MLYYVIIIYYIIIFYDIILYYIILYYITLHYIMLHSIILYYVSPHCKGKKMSNHRSLSRCSTGLFAILSLGGLSTLNTSDPVSGGNEAQIPETE